MAKSSQETRRIHQGASFIIASTQSTLGFSGTNQGLGLQGFPSLHACGVFLFLFCVPWDVLFLLCPTVAAMIKLSVIYISYKQSLEKGALFIAQLKKKLRDGLWSGLSQLAGCFSVKLSNCETVKGKPTCSELVACRHGNSESQCSPFSQ